MFPKIQKNKKKQHYPQELASQNVTNILKLKLIHQFLEKENEEVQPHVAPLT